MSNQTNGTRNKIHDLDELAATLDAVRTAGSKIVHCHGVFDLLHIGHIRHFEEARRLGDVLVVTVTPDIHVNKGPGRPAFNQDLRAEAIAALDCVDYVAINRWPMAVETIRLVRPDVYAKGSDYEIAGDDRSGGISLEQAAVEAVGGRLAFTNDITFSSSNLINRHLPVFEKEVSEYLAGFAARQHSGDVLRYLDGARSLKVLVIGETIIDDYLYCETLGKSGKEPVLAARHVNSEKFAGGIVAVANHVSAFTDNVSMLTVLGSVDSQEEFVRQQTNPNIDGIFLHMGDGAPTIVKRRFVEIHPLQKLFELYVMDDREDKAVQKRELLDKLEELLPRYDVVVVADYGHGMLGPEAVELLCSRAPFLAINTQVNAGNRSFNTVSKYRRADYICISENEIRLAARSRGRDLRDIVVETGESLSCSRIVVTQGSRGCLCYSKEEGFFEVPALATHVVDRVGAGDSVFSVSALCVAQDAPMEIVGFIGNAAGAEAVATIGHRSSIQRVPLYRHIESLMK